MITSAQLKELIISAGYEPYSYSGRGMYGSECVAFTVKRGEIFSVIAELVAASVDYEYIADFTQVLRQVKWDSMGLDTVIYFPRMEWVEEYE